MNEETLGIPVIGIGVPTVVDGATIVHDAIAHLLENLEEAEMEEFLQELITPRLHRMFVTPKDVDETVKKAQLYDLRGHQYRDGGIRSRGIHIIQVCTPGKSEVKVRTGI